MGWWTLRRKKKDARQQHQHQCCAWCQDGVHAEVVFVDKRYGSAEEFLQRARPIEYALSGKEILSARPALEADREAMIAYRQRVKVSVVDSTSGEELDETTMAEPPWVWGTPWVLFYQ